MGVTQTEPGAAEGCVGTPRPTPSRTEGRRKTGEDWKEFGKMGSHTPIQLGFSKYDYYFMPVPQVDRM